MSEKCPTCNRVIRKRKALKTDAEKLTDKTKSRITAGLRKAMPAATRYK